MSWHVGSLAPGATGIITLTGIFSPSAGGEERYINVARIGSGETDIVTANNSSSAELILRRVEIYLPILMR